RDRNVGRRCDQCTCGKAWAECARPHSYLEDGGDEPGPGDLDRRVPDSFGRISRNIAVDVNDSGGTDRGDVSRIGAGIFILSLHSDHGCGYLLRLAEITARQRRKSNWGFAD